MSYITIGNTSLSQEQLCFKGLIKYDIWWQVTGLTLNLFVLGLIYSNSIKFK